MAALNDDPEVMRYFPARLPRDQSDELAARIRAKLERDGWGLWAVEVVGGPHFIGFVGLNDVTFTAPFTPAVEVGWRLARAAWGNGFATEAATAAIAVGFADVGLDEIVSFTSTVNERSMRVMQRLGMKRSPEDDFDHPTIPEGLLRRHVVYRLKRTDWENG